MALHRPAFGVLACLLLSGALTTGVVHGQTFEGLTEPWDIVLARSLVEFEALHAVRPPAIGVPASREWELALIDALSGILAAGHESGLPELFQLAHDLTGAYVDGILYGDEARIVAAFELRELFRELTGL